MRVLHIQHATEYRFDRPVTLLPHQLRIRPRQNHRVKLVSSMLHIEPGHVVRWSSDALDNSVALVSFHAPANRLLIDSDVVVEHYNDAPLDFLVDQRAFLYPFEYTPEEARLLTALRTSSYPHDRSGVREWLRRMGLDAAGSETYALLSRLNHAVHEGWASIARIEEGVLSPTQTFARSGAACRDLAALFVEASRCMGFASRFVSGYLHAPQGDPSQASTHAWAEVYVPGPGWLGFDPTSGLVAGNQHVAVAVALHPEDVPPVAGSYTGSNEARPSMHVRVQVRDATTSKP